MLISVNVLNWYRDDFGFSLPLIDTFVSLMEQQAEDSIQKYKTEKQSEVVVEDLGGDYGIHGELVETYLGLDSTSYSFVTVFEEYFPSLQRRSALLTVCGFFEYELHKLCVLFKGERKLRLGPYDLHGRGIEQSVDYLEKVVGLKLDKKSDEWKALTYVREIRNLIVHRDGRVRDAQGKIFPACKDALANLQHLNSKGEEIVLEKGFVSEVVDTFRTYFKLIDNSIRENEKHRNDSSAK
jgi:hypothetical protein